MTHATMNRRKALAAVAVAPAALVSLPTLGLCKPATQGGDAELLKLGAELQRLWDMERPLWDACQKASDQEDFERAEHHLENAAKYQGKSWAVAHRIAALSATTIAGLKVKALAHRYMLYQSDESELEFEQPDQELAWGMCEDIEAMEAQS